MSNLKFVYRSRSPKIMDTSGPDLPPPNFKSQLASGLLDDRMVVVTEALATSVVGEITEQLVMLDTESDKPIHVIMSNAPGGDVEAGLSIHGLIESLDAPVTALASGRIAGAGVLGFLGASADRRLSLPHARFRFQEPTDSLEYGVASDLDQKAQSAHDRHERVLTILSEATGQSRDQIEADFSSKRAFEPDEAVRYGLINRVVQSRDAVR